MERPSVSATQIIYAELATIKAQNARLEEENLLLRHRLNRVSTDQQTNASLNVEAKVKAFQLEEERDRILETLQLHKKKYNKLHDAYLAKVKRCKALEEMFMRQKTLSGLVMKSAIAQRNAEQQMMLEKRRSQQSSNSETELKQLETKLAKLQAALDESYDIIDEMDFELESVDLLEMQNQNLREELAQLKAQLTTPPEAAAAPAPAAAATDEDEPPPKYEEDNKRQHAAASICECCLKIDDAGADSLERAAMTNSLVQTIESESSCLRRELLRSRLRRTVRAKLEKEEED